jgi:hypothetical protein
MGLNTTRLARPFRANEIMETLHPGLRCAPPWAIVARRFAAIMVRRFAAKEMMETLHPGLRCAPPWAIVVRRFAAVLACRFAAIMARRFAAETTIAPCSMAIKSCLA